LQGHRVADFAAIAAFVSNVDRLDADRAFMMQISAGMPARTTELAAQKLKNTINGRRDVFFLGGALAIVGDYNKADAAPHARRRVVARFPDRETSAVTVIYLAMTRLVYTVTSELLLNRDTGPHEKKKLADAHMLNLR
jgi:hypothetical protein